MRAFSLIFTIYILFLSFQPCEEMTANVGLKSNKTLQQSQIQAAGQAADECDNCSPFCICSCCHFSTAYQFSPFTVTSKITASAILRPVYHYQNPYSKAYKNPVWQPPKYDSIG